MAHLLSTGILTAADAALVAERLARPDLDGGRGLRTLSSTSAGFDPLTYHCGSVWPHDTAIAVLGLAGIGRHDVARSLGEGLIAAAAEFDDRLPELYAEVDGETVSYPTACRPQAWAAAGAVAVVGYLSGWPIPDWTRGA
jgi:glycogen debranching enzyme